MILNYFMFLVVLHTIFGNSGSIQVRLDPEVGSLGNAQFQVRLDSPVPNFFLNRNISGPSPTVAVLNDYADLLIREVNKYMGENHLNSFDAPSFDKKFGWSVFSGYVNLTDGKLNDLNTIKRTDDVVAEYIYPNLKVTAPLGFENLNFDYAYVAKFMGMGPSDRAYGKVPYCDFIASLGINLNNFRAVLHDFHVVKLEGINVRLEGPIIIDKVVTAIANAIIPKFESSIPSEVNTFISKYMNEMIDTYNHKVCLLLKDC